MFFKYYIVWFIFSFRRPIGTHWKNHMILWFLNRLWNISQSSKTHATLDTPHIDICKNKQEFSNFWAISYFQYKC